LQISDNVHGEKVVNTTSSALKTKRTNTSFKRTASFVHKLTQKSFEKRGFAQSRLITNWNEIIGLEFSQISKPVKITFPKNDFGATLTIEIDGSFGPELDMQKDIIKEKVNRIYGYSAVARIKFKASSCFGYDSLNLNELFLRGNNKDIQSEQTSCVDQNNDKSLLKMDDVKDHQLRKSLSDLSNNFFKRRKT
tara:strand:+ start:377 stop:955 length:579 start_codon:yes stop_codon:yes gene_type:complete